MWLLYDWGEGYEEKGMEDDDDDGKKLRLRLR